MHFTAFHPDWKMRNIPNTPAASLKRARDIAIGNGVRYAYTGNVHDSAGGSTRCHHCDYLLIERDWYQLGHYELDDRGHCGNCGATLPGIYDGPPGDWGRRRQPVKISDL